MSESQIQKRYNLSKRTLRISKLFYVKKSAIEISSLQKSQLKDLVVHIKPVRYYHLLSSQHKFDFLKFLNYKTKIKLQNDESSIVPIHYFKRLKKFETNELPLTLYNMKSLVQVMKHCYRTMLDVSLRFTNFQSLTASECVQLHLIICNQLKKLNKVEKLELVLAVFTQEILKIIGKRLEAFCKLKTLAIEFPQKPLNLESWKHVAKGIGKQQLLQDFTLKINLVRKDAEIPENYFDFLLNLQNLRTLNLILYQVMSNNFLTFLNQSVLRLPNLKKFYLRLWSIEYSHEDTLELFKNLDFPELVSFGFNANRIEDLNGKGFRRFTQLIRSCQNLTRLILALKYSYLSLETYNVLSECFSPKLQYIHMCFKNQIIQSDCYLKLLQHFESLVNLTDLELDFSMTQMVCAAFVNVVSCLKSLQSIKRLLVNVGANEIKDQGILAFAAVITTLKTLTHLEIDLSGNNFTTVGLHSLVEAIKSHSQLLFLKINIKDCRNLTITMRHKINDQLKTCFPSLAENKTLIIIR